MNNKTVKTNSYNYPLSRIYKIFILSTIFVTSSWLLYLGINYYQKRSPHPYFQSQYKIQPLVMKDGDPHIRALMRTITASEANVSKPYHVLYGGKYVPDLKKHPDRCITIVTGPNRGNCTTAAGRYQFLNTTWAKKAKQYHPHPSGLLWWQSYSFEPEYQDKVVYGWLNDPNAWGVNIVKLLQEGKIEQVLRLLSGTWTSLGYGIENNSMSSQLPKIYQQMLQEELNKL
jgi:muramidase (phage lysozyme)